ncbi:uncharacterized protein [Porites lutea]|uniref:uncharacterized protein n=1 Tax=Porites lutea TaxID=51062 RepID=UPI003CC66BC2
MQSDVGIFDAKDREFYEIGDQQLVSLNQDGPIAGHYMQVDGGAVLTNAKSSNQRTLFKTHTIIEYDATGSNHQVVILENKHDGNVVAINKDEDTVIAKELTRPPSSYDTLEEVRAEHPEALFYKVPREPGCVKFYFKSYLKDKQRILGFDDYGNALDPTQVQLGQKESLFQMM